MLHLTDRMLELTLELERAATHWEREPIQAEIDEAKQELARLDREAQGDQVKNRWRERKGSDTRRPHCRDKKPRSGAWRKKFE